MLSLFCTIKELLNLMALHIQSFIGKLVVFYSTIAVDASIFLPSSN